MTFLQNVLILIALIPVTFWVLNWMLRGLDKRAGFNWPKVRMQIHDNPMAAAIYFGARFVGSCILLAAILGRYLI
jgi:hypothetical protein